MSALNTLKHKSITLWCALKLLGLSEAEICENAPHNFYANKESSFGVSNANKCQGGRVEVNPPE